MIVGHVILLSQIRYPFLNFLSLATSTVNTLIMVSILVFFFLVICPQATYTMSTLRFDFVLIVNIYEMYADWLGSLEHTLAVPPVEQGLTSTSLVGCQVEKWPQFLS